MADDQNTSTNATPNWWEIARNMGNYLMGNSQPGSSQKATSVDFGANTVVNQPMVHVDQPSKIETALTAVKSGKPATEQTALAQPMTGDSGKVSPAETPAKDPNSQLFDYLRERDKATQDTMRGLSNQWQSAYDANKGRVQEAAENKPDWSWQGVLSRIMNPHANKTMGTEQIMGAAANNLLGSFQPIYQPLTAHKGKGFTMPVGYRFRPDWLMHGWRDTGQDEEQNQAISRGQMGLAAEQANLGSPNESALAKSTINPYGMLMASMLAKEKIPTRMFDKAQRTERPFVPDARYEATELDPALKAFKTLLGDNDSEFADETAKQSAKQEALVRINVLNGTPQGQALASNILNGFSPQQKNTIADILNDKQVQSAQQSQPDRQGINWSAWAE